MHDFIKTPTQERSRGTMKRIYRSLSTLLRTKSFDRITIAEIAKDADVASGSIYARFKDKNALLAGLYAGLANEAIECFSELTGPERWVDTETDEMVAEIIERVIHFYRRNAHISRAAVLSDQSIMYDEMRRVWQASIDKVITLLSRRMPTIPLQNIDHAARFTVRIVTSVMNQAVIVTDVATLQPDTSDRELGKQLSHVCCWILRQPA
jgi:AcrR family transcriptional regulator